MRTATERTAAPAAPGRGLWLRWTAMVTLGEFAGFSLPAAAGAAGWALALPVLVFAGVMVAAGAVEGSLLGFAQWLVLRRYVAGAGWWVPANALAWALGMTWVFAGMAPVGEDDPAALMAAVAAASGLLMGATVAAATGAALVWLLRRQGPRDEASIAAAA